MCYSRSELLSLNLGRSTRLERNTWKRIVSLGINAIRPTHRGSKGSKSRPNLPLQRNIDTQTSPSPSNGAHIKLCLWNARSLRNKTTMFSDYVLEQDIDCAFITESWLKENDPVVMREVTPPGYCFINIPRASVTYGGGIGVLFKNGLKIQLYNIDKPFRTFEYTCVTTNRKDVFYFVIYRPPPSTENGLKTNDFLEEFYHLIELINSMNSNIIIVGDFNLHVDTPDKTDVFAFSYNMYRGLHTNTGTPLILSFRDLMKMLLLTVWSTQDSPIIMSFRFNACSRNPVFKRSRFHLVD